MIEWLIPAIEAVVVPCVGYLVVKVVDTDKRLTAHIAETLAVHTGINNALSDLKNGQTNQTEKLDRLIEGNLRDAMLAARDRASAVTDAASVAMQIVEAAKKSAIEVVAEAARIAVNRIPLSTTSEKDC